MANMADICARDYRTGEGRRVFFRDGRVESIEPTDALGDVWLAPGIFDLQVNGYAGIDFQRDGLVGDDLQKAAAGLRDDGCGRWLLTLISDEFDVLLKRLRLLKKLRDGDDELRRSIQGWHVEGPFLSAELGYRGAHDGGVMRDATVADIERLHEVVEDDLVLLTVAPERGGMVSAVRRAVELGMKVSLGHCNPSVGDLAAAKEAGAVAFTHLGNGCPQELDRHDNVLWRVFDEGGLVAGMIPDGIHVSPLLFRLMHKALEPDMIYYTTDSISAAGASPGCYTVGRLELEVGGDQVVRHPGQTNFAGSALRPWQGVKRAAAMLGVSWREVWDGFSTRPTELMGLKAGITAGDKGSLCLVREDGEGDLVSVEVLV